MKIDWGVLKASATQAFHGVGKVVLFIVLAVAAAVGLILWVGAWVTNPLPTLIATPFIAGAICTVDLYRKNLKRKRKYGR